MEATAEEETTEEATAEEETTEEVKEPKEEAAAEGLRIQEELKEMEEGCMEEEEAAAATGTTTTWEKEAN